MKKVLALTLAIVMILAVLPVVGASAAEVEAEKARPEEMERIEWAEKLLFTTRDITNAQVAWVKQATGVLIWVPAIDDRAEDEIIAQAQAADSSLINGTRYFEVMRGYVAGLTPNENGSQADVAVDEKDGRIIMSITGNFSHFGFIEKEAQTEEPVDPEQPAEAETAQIRIDAPQKMAVVFEDGTVYYGGEMKEVVVGKEYAFQMCSVNWDNGIYDENGNGIAGTVVYRMIAVHQDEFNAIAAKAKEDTERFTVKGIDVIDNKDKKIYVNIDAEDTHLETDVNNFFMAYRFHFDGEDYNKKTGIAQVVNTPLESLSVNLPLGTTVGCDAFEGDEKIDDALVFVTNNSGTGIYYNVELTSVNDFTWGDQFVKEYEAVEAVEQSYEAQEEIRDAK